GRLEQEARKRQERRDDRVRVWLLPLNRERRRIADRHVLDERELGRWLRQAPLDLRLLHAIAEGNVVGGQRLPVVPGEVRPQLERRLHAAVRQESPAVRVQLRDGRG